MQEKSVEKVNSKTNYEAQKIKKDAFRRGEKLPYFFTIHYYLLLPDPPRASAGRVGRVAPPTEKPADGLVFLLEAPPGIGPGMKVLQTSALPLGYGALFFC